MSTSLKQVLLVQDIINKGFGEILKDPSKEYKSLFRGKDYKGIYNMLLESLGYPLLFTQKETTPTGEDLAVCYLETMVTYGLPLFDFEKTYLEDLVKEQKSSIDLSLVLTNTLCETKIGIEKIVKGDIMKKIPYLCQNIVKRIRSTTHILDKYEEGTEVDEETVGKILSYLKNAYTLKVSDTNIMIGVPTNINKERFEIYLPSYAYGTDTEFKEETGYDFILQSVLECIESRGYVGVIPKVDLRSIRRVLEVEGNLYQVHNNKIAYALFQLDILMRRAYLTCIKDTVEDVIDFGTPIYAEKSKTPALMIGNYDESISIQIASTSFRVAKESISMVLNLMERYELCTDRKVICIKDDGEKVPVWNKVYLNAKPLDGNYNNLLKNNVK